MEQRPSPDPSDDHARGNAALDDVDTVVEPIAEGAAVGPAVGIAALGGPLVALPADVPVPGLPGPDVAIKQSLRAGLLEAGPVAVAGLVVNIAAALVVVAVARLVPSRTYGQIAQVLGIFFILSMPGSAVLVGVVRRISGMRASGHGDQVRRWVTRVHRLCMVGLVVLLVAVVVASPWIARLLALPDGRGVGLILMAGGVWILLCVDRGHLQADRRYRGLAANLLVEGGVRTVLVVALVAAGWGVAGYALAVLVSEVLATGHARWLGGKARAIAVDDSHGGAPPVVDVASDGDGVVARRRLLADVAAAFAGLALLGLLQNVDVIVLGRLNHGQIGAYAAISVAAKGLVFGALALGAYLLPEATIRWNAGGHAVRQLVVTLIFLAVPAGVLLVISVVAPRQFLTAVFSARLATAAPSLATLVVAMMCLSFTVLATNYLFGTGSRWIVAILALGGGGAVVLTIVAHGSPSATARADLWVQSLVAAAMGGALVLVHLRHRGEHWRRGQGWRKRPGFPSGH